MRKLFSIFVGALIALSFASCEKDNTPKVKEFVDLGLPSGTLWSNVNENNPKDTYGFYIFDEAITDFGTQVPTKAQWEELLQFSTYEKTKSGCKIIGRNGNTIFLPYAGYRDCNGVGSTGDGFGCYWTSTAVGDYDPDNAYDITFRDDMDEPYIAFGPKCFGYSVRLIQVQK